MPRWTYETIVDMGKHKPWMQAATNQKKMNHRDNQYRKKLFFQASGLDPKQKLGRGTALKEVLE